MTYHACQPPTTPPTATRGAADVVAVGLGRLRGMAPMIAPIVGSAD